MSALDDLAFWAVMVGGFLFTYRKVYIGICESEHGDLDAAGRLLNAGMAAFLSLFWPLVLAFLVLHRFVTPTTPGERAAALDEREAEIRRLERELGIGDRR